MVSKLVKTLIFLFSLTVYVDADCIWYDECGDSGTGKYNCKYQGKPKLLESNLETFKELCPHLYTGDNSTETCCAPSQVQTLHDNLSVPKQLLSRCPSCYTNFRAFLCDLTCHPKSSEFLLVTNEKEYNETDMEIVQITYHMTKLYADELFNSCKDVQYSSSGQKVMDLICGSPSGGCTPQKLVSFLGNNDQSPFIFDMNVTDSEYDYNSTLHITPVNTSMHHCNNNIDMPFYKATACGCSDCEDACPIPIPPPVEKQCLIWSFECLNVVLLGLFVIFSVTFILTIFITRNREIKQNSYQEFSDTKIEEDRESINQSIEPAQISFLEKIGGKTEEFLESFFQRLGYFCATHPVIVLTIGILACLILSGGFYFLSITSDPVELWSPPESKTRQNKNYFDTHFQPFYRTTQVIIRSTDKTPYLHKGNYGQLDNLYSSIFRKEFLLAALQLQNDLASLTGTLDNNQTVTLDEVCFKPLNDSYSCTIQSIFAYWQNKPENIEKVAKDDFDLTTADYIDHFETCVAAPTNQNDSIGLSCLGDYGGTVMPFVALGDYPSLTKPEYGNASALLLSFIINNHKDPAQNLKAMAWEKSAIAYLKNFSHPNMTISFNTERSIQDELDRESKSDIITIFLSYVAMFFYVGITLGRYSSDRPQSPDESICFKFWVYLDMLRVNMKFIIGSAGVWIVLFSVTSSIGFFSYLGVKTTLIIFEVIPFLVLAVGVDNIFILIQNVQRDTRLENETIEHQISRIVGKVGPSMLLTSCSESLAFLLGSLTPMPAVKIFTLYAAVAIFIDFLLQITCFVSLMTLDFKREAAKRYNFYCCFTSPYAMEVDAIVPSSSNYSNYSDVNKKNNESLEKLNESAGNDSGHKVKKNNGFLFNVFNDYYAPFLMDFKVRPIVMVVFLGWLLVSAAYLPKVKTGLDQKLSMPTDSYVLDYFEALEKYLSVGVPVYFVVKSGQNYSFIENQNVICASSGCNSDSLLNQISIATLQPEYTKLAIPSNSWIDDYFDWLSSDCCRVHNNTGLFCPSDSDITHCVQCPVQNLPNTNRPISKDFYKYLNFFLEDNPGVKCAKGGHAAYGQSLEIKHSPRSKNTSYEIGATMFMAYHTVGVTSYDFIESLRHANELSANVTKMMKENAKKWSNDTQFIDSIEVFPYSVSYVFYEQYLTIWKDAIINLSISLAAIFIITTILLGLDFYTAFIICFTITMIVINMFGAMHLLNIDLNAISVVNLVMAIGISVEFCAHTARGFAMSLKGSRVKRAQYAFK